MRTIDLAPTAAYLLKVPMPQHSQGVVRLDLLRGSESRTLVPILALTDFHGQLDPTTVTHGRAATCRWAARRSWRRCSTRRPRPSAGPSFLFASGDNVGASPANSGLLKDMPAIDVENAWGLDATSYGNHEFDYGVERLQEQQARANFPFLGANIVDEVTRLNPDWVQGTHVFDYGNSRIGVIGIELKETPELVSAGATAGLKFLDEAETIKAESEKLRQQGVKIQIVLIHQGAALGEQRGGRHGADAVGRPDRDDREQDPGHAGGRDLCGAHAPHRELHGRGGS